MAPALVLKAHTTSWASRLSGDMRGSSMTSLTLLTGPAGHLHCQTCSQESMVAPGLFAVHTRHSCQGWGHLIPCQPCTFMVSPQTQPLTLASQLGPTLATPVPRTYPAVPPSCACPLVTLAFPGHNPPQSCTCAPGLHLPALFPHPVHSVHVPSQAISLAGNPPRDPHPSLPAQVAP